MVMDKCDVWRADLEYQYQGKSLPAATNWLCQTGVPQSEQPVHEDTTYKYTSPFILLNLSVIFYLSVFFT